MENVRIPNLDEKMVVAKIYFTLNMKTMKQISEGNICDQRTSATGQITAV